MRKFHTLWHPEAVHLGRIDSTNENPIWVGSPLYGLPSNDLDCFSPPSPLRRQLLLDVNILAAIRERSRVADVQNLFALAASHGLEVSPIVAVAEQHRTHAAPDKAFKQYVQALREDYSYDLPDSEVNRLLGVFREHSPGVSHNVDLFAHYYVIAKHFYHKRWSAERKVREFAELIHTRNVPVLAFAFLLSCVYFYVREFPNDFSPNVVSKVQSDMCVHGDKEKERRHLKNLASDLMFFMTPADIFFSHDSSEFNFCYIASCDQSIGLILSELAYSHIVVGDDRCFGAPGFRPGGKVGRHLEKVVTKHLRQSPQHSLTYKGRADNRVSNLEQLAEEMMST